MTKAKKNNGKWASAKNKDRARPLLALTMSRHAQEILDSLADRASYSRGVVAEALILREDKRLAGGASAVVQLAKECEAVANQAKIPTK